jgi:hypothetical protein
MRRDHRTGGTVALDVEAPRAIAAGTVLNEELNIACGCWRRRSLAPRTHVELQHERLKTRMGIDGRYSRGAMRGPACVNALPRHDAPPNKE